ncbi:hyaluronidase-2-like [Antechinus flavipes]|uniref:hyaluronidase-2-like n=1 Tax=Antechinus flavipes TaxID=38775 RepID=UPI002236921F|nr:hyaluronidase-2-like [Antechinus flavipes]
MERDLEAAIPSRAFSGLSVIDWETWRPLWVRNWDKKGVYRAMSARLVRQRYPTWPQGRMELQAQWEFETAAARFMSETLRLARARRPGGWWGYYLFPDCYNYHYWEDFENFTGHCPGIERQRNNALLWLWEQSRALYPSIYLEEVLRGSAQGERFVRAKVREALRVAELPPSASYSLPVFVYARPFYSYTLKELAQVGAGQSPSLSSVGQPDPGGAIQGTGHRCGAAASASQAEGPRSEPPSAVPSGGNWGLSLPSGSVREPRRSEFQCDLRHL